MSAASSAETAVKIRDLSLVFQTGDGPVAALADIELVIGRGEFVSFIGPSGRGKTTLPRVIADLDRPAIIEVPTTTIFLHRGQGAIVDTNGNYLVEVR